MSDEPILKKAQDKLRPFEHQLLDAFSKVFQRKRPPTSLRSLQPLAMVFLLEAFGLAFLLDRATVRLAILAARGPGKGDDDMLDDGDQLVAVRWASARQEAVDRAYMAVAKERYKETKYSNHDCPNVAAWLRAGYGPDRAQFEKQWGERNPIDPAMAPKSFDPSAQLSTLDAVGQGDGYLGAFVFASFLAASTRKQITCMGQTLDLDGCETIDAAAAKAVLAGWIAYLDHRGAVAGLRLIPRTDGIQTRLRAPLANVVSMYQEDKRDEQISDLESRIAEITEQATINNNALRERDHQWQDATGANDPEMARAMMAQQIEQIAGLTAERAIDEREPDTAIEPENALVLDNSKIFDETNGVGRMVWPDPDNAPTPIACASAIVAHRRGEFVELEFPATPKIFDNVRAFLEYHDLTIREPTPDATGYCTCAIGTAGELPPAWSGMKQRERDSYPGFALFGPDGSAKVVFRAREQTVKTPRKPRSKKAAT